MTKKTGFAIQEITVRGSIVSAKVKISSSGFGVSHIPEFQVTIGKMPEHSSLTNLEARVRSEVFELLKLVLVEMSSPGETVVRPLPDGSQEIAFKNPNLR